MYYVITRNDDTLVGVTYDNAYLLNLPDVSIHEMQESIPDLNVMRWDFELGDFVKREGVEGTTVYSKLQFLSKFTMPERIAIATSTDLVVQDIMKMFNLANYIDVSRPDTQQSVGYLAQVGLIQPSRIAEILS